MIRSTTIANKVYKYVHDEDVWLETNLQTEAHENDVLRIESGGKIMVKGSVGNGYAWDGCSPKKHFLHFLIGTPDGKLDYRTEKPITYYASMVHDIIYQFKSEVDISRKEADVLFKITLKESGFMWSGLYYLMVRLFGGFYGKWKKKQSATDIKINQSSWIKDQIN